MSEPRTAAGRTLLDDLAYLRGNYAPMILDIEDEAAASGIVEQRLIQSIEAEAASSAAPGLDVKKLIRLAKDWRISDEFIGKVVRSQYPARWPGDPGAPAMTAGSEPRTAAAVRLANLDRLANERERQAVMRARRESLEMSKRGLGSTQHDLYQQEVEHMLARIAGGVRIEAEAASPSAAPGLDVERLADFILEKIESEPYQGLHPELASMGLAIAIRDEFHLASGVEPTGRKT